MNLRSAMRQIQANIIAGNAVVLTSPPGFGKTDLMAKVAIWFLAYIKASNPNARVGMAVQFLATANPISATGMPWKDAKTWTHPVTGKEVTLTVTDPAIPQWYMAVDLETSELRPASLFDVVLLVLEEWGQGSAEAKRAFAEILRAGGTPPYYLPAGSPRIALSNTDTRDGVTKEFDFIINRRAELVVTGDVDVWHDDFADKPYQWQGKTWQMLGVSKVWARRNPGILFEPKPVKQGAWCTPRSFTAQDRYVQAATQLNDGVIPLNDPSFREGCAGHCGMAQTQSYLATLQFVLELPSMEEIVKDPAGTPVPTKADLQMLLAYELAGRVKPNQLEPVLQFIGRLPKDFNITFASSLLRRDYASFIQEPAMTKWISKNAQIVGIIGTLAK